MEGFAHAVGCLYIMLQATLWTRSLFNMQGSLNLISRLKGYAYLS